jgi:hypothetical protein
MPQGPEPLKKRTGDGLDVRLSGPVDPSPPTDHLTGGLEGFRVQLERQKGDFLKIAKRLGSLMDNVNSANTVHGIRGSGKDSAASEAAAPQDQQQQQPSYKRCSHDRRLGIPLGDYDYDATQDWNSFYDPLLPMESMQKNYGPPLPPLVTCCWAHRHVLPLSQKAPDLKDSAPVLAALSHAIQEGKLDNEVAGLPKHYPQQGHGHGHGHHHSHSHSHSHSQHAAPEGGPEWQRLFGPSASHRGVPGLLSHGESMPDEEKHYATLKNFRPVVAELRAGLTNEPSVKVVAKQLAETRGIIFIDELDKLVTVDRYQKFDEGVQRDLLPYLEGHTVDTVLGPLSTKHMLFIGAGAFLAASVRDLLPELLGRLPIRVAFRKQTEQDLYDILTKPLYSIVRQHQLLIEAEGGSLKIEEPALRYFARAAFHLNRDEDLGARRLHALLEKTMQRMASKDGAQHVVVTEQVAKDTLGDIFTVRSSVNYFL